MLHAKNTNITKKLKFAFWRGRKHSSIEKMMLPVIAILRLSKYIKILYHLNKALYEVEPVIECDLIPTLPAHF